jgi:hypothetical protein
MTQTEQIKVIIKELKKNGFNAKFLKRRNTLFAAKNNRVYCVPFDREDANNTEINELVLMGHDEALRKAFKIEKFEGPNIYDMSISERANFQGNIFLK